MFKRPKSPGLNLAVKQTLAARSSRKFPNISQLKTLPLFLSPKERRVLRGGVAIFGLALILLSWSLWQSFSVVVPAQGGTYTEGIVGYPQFINPLYSDANPVDRDLVKLLMSGLFKEEADRGIATDLALSFSKISDQDNEKTYAIDLKPNLKWHDGENLTTADIVFTIEAIKNPEYSSPLQSDFSDIQVVAIDDDSLQLTSKQSLPELLKNLTVPILPAHLWERVSPQYARLSPLNTHPIGSGPFAFSKLVKDSRGTPRVLDLVAFEQGGERPFLDKFSLKFFADGNSLRGAMEKGAVDGTVYLSPLDSRAFLDNPGRKVYAYNNAEAVLIGYNLSATGLTLERRAALEASINREQIDNEVYGGLAKIVTEPAEIYGKEGAGTSGTVTPLSEEVALKLVVIDKPNLRQIAKVVTENWTALGVKTTVEYIGPESIQETLGKRSYDAILIGEWYGSLPMLEKFFNSNGSFNISGWKNKEADGIVNQINDLPEIDLNLLGQLGALIKLEWPASFLVSPPIVYVSNQKIQGLTVGMRAGREDRLSNVSQWYLKTKRVLRRE